MKKLSVILQILFILISLSATMGQENIRYGSNNGKYISIYDSRIYYEEYGEGTPLLLLHGGLDSIHYYRMVIPELSNHFRVIAVDSPGHGRSEQADTLSYQLMTDYISKLIDIMGLESVYVLGFSDGAVVALLLAHDRPERVKRIICEGGVINFDGYYPSVRPYIEKTSPQTMEKNWIEGYKSKSPQPDKWEKFVLDTKKMWLEDPYIPDSKISKIKSRTLIVMGDRDSAIKIEHGIQLYRTIKGSEFCVLPNVGHGICDKKPDLMNKIAIEFLKRE